MRPIHKAVQTPERGNALGARSQHQVIGVAEDDPRAGRRYPLGGHRLDCAGGAHRHEYRRFDSAVSGRQPPAPRGAVARQNLEADHVSPPTLTRLAALATLSRRV